MPGGKIVMSKMSIAKVGWKAFFTDPDDIMQGIRREDRDVNKVFYNFPLIINDIST